jgi:hypothetical protein
VFEEFEEVPEDEEFSSLAEHDSIRPKVNAKIVGKKRNFSFFIEPKYALDT